MQLEKIRPDMPRPPNSINADIQKPHLRRRRDAAEPGLHPPRETQLDLDDLLGPIVRASKRLTNG
jgi:hypothetical protein